MSRLQERYRRVHRSRHNRMYSFALRIWREERHALHAQIARARDDRDLWQTCYLHKKADLGDMKRRIGEMKQGQRDPKISENLRGLQDRVDGQRQQIHRMQAEIARLQAEIEALVSARLERVG